MMIIGDSKNFFAMIKYYVGNPMSVSQLKWNYYYFVKNLLKNTELEQRSNHNILHIYKSFLNKWRQSTSTIQYKLNIWICLGRIGLIPVDTIVNASLKRFLEWQSLLFAVDVMKITYTFQVLPLVPQKVTIQPGVINCMILEDNS